MQWMERLLAPEGGDGGGGEGESGGGADGTEGKAPPSGGGKGGAAPPSPADLTSLKLDGDWVPEKFRGKTPKDVMDSYSSLQREFSKAQDKLREATDGTEAIPATTFKQFRTDLQEAVEAGGWNPKKLERWTSMGADPEELTLIAESVTATKQRAYDRIANRLLEDPDVGYDVDVRAVLEAAVQSGNYTPDQLVLFEANLREGFIEPFKRILNDFTEAGVDPRTITSDGAAGRNPGASPGPGGVAPKRGFIGNQPDVTGYATRADMVNEQRKAHEARQKGDMAAWERHQVRLRKSNPHRWPDRRLA